MGFKSPPNKGPVGMVSLSPVPPCRLTPSPTYGSGDKGRGLGFGIYVDLNLPSFTSDTIFGSP